MGGAQIKCEGLPQWRFFWEVQPNSRSVFRELPCAHVRNCKVEKLTHFKILFPLRTQDPRFILCHENYPGDMAHSNSTHWCCHPTSICHFCCPCLYGLDPTNIFNEFSGAFYLSVPQTQSCPYNSPTGQWPGRLHFTGSLCPYRSFGWRLQNIYLKDFLHIL